MRLLNAMMGRFVQTGTLRIIDAEGNEHVHRGDDGPEVTVRLTDPGLYKALALNPELRAGEAYTDGRLVVEQGTIRDLLLIFALNRSNLRGQKMQKSLRRIYKKLRKFQQRNVASRSKANVAHHYDISNDLYRLFLDEDLNYSCAYFMSDDDTIEIAQQNKLRHIAAKLALKPGHRVLDIGSGWGGMALYLADNADVEVVGVTLSEDQQALATERAKQRGLHDRVRFDLVDYRDVSDSFDRIVSIGMFEHVGVQFYPQYFQKIRDMLSPDGVALVHSIGRSGRPGATSAWIRKYIFPGSYAPALSEAVTAVEQSGLWLTDVEILRRHYAETLLAWDTRFQARRDEVAEMFDEQFCRMWEFYLIACEMGFRFGKQMVFQMQLARSIDAIPITRDYMLREEGSLKLAESA